MPMTIIPGEWKTTVTGTATGNVIITQRSGDQDEVTIIIPAEYNLAMCNAIHHAHEAAKAGAA